MLDKAREPPVLTWLKEEVGLEEEIVAEVAPRLRAEHVYSVDALQLLHDGTSGILWFQSWAWH